MSFPYDSTIPNPADPPADDAAVMQTNSGSISSILAVDHVGFYCATWGKHTLVTFAYNNNPGVYPSYPVL
jgi:hypothetical protein